MQPAKEEFKGDKRVINTGMADHNSLDAHEKTINLPTILMGQNADILHIVSAALVYKNIIDALLAADYRSQQRGRTQLTVHGWRAPLGG
jgi:hypothetical protein